MSHPMHGAALPILACSIPPAVARDMLFTGALQPDGPAAYSHRKLAATQFTESFGSPSPM